MHVALTAVWSGGALGALVTLLVLLAAQNLAAMMPVHTRGRESSDWCGVGAQGCRCTVDLVRGHPFLERVPAPGQIDPCDFWVAVEIHSHSRGFSLELCWRR